MHFDSQTRRKLVITNIQSGSDRTLLNESKCSITGRVRQSLLTPERCFVPSARRKCESSWRHQTTIGGKRGGSRVRRVRPCAIADGLRVQSPTRHKVGRDPAEERPAAVRGAALADQSGHRAGAGPRVDRRELHFCISIVTPVPACTLSRCLTRSCQSFRSIAASITSSYRANVAALPLRAAL
jgi:hypothetical protein